MRALIFLFVLVPVVVFAKSYMVYNYTSDVRIVLSAESCLVNTLTGSRAVVQRSDGVYIRGCWKFIDNDKHVRIDWDNPNVPGDFAVINAKLFKPETE
jgi:hypothetical protein